MTSVINCQIQSGNGPALFLTHGIGASKDVWKFMLPYLSKHFK